MYQREFQTILNSPNLPNYWLLRSNDEFLNELFAKELKLKFAHENCLSVYYDEYDFAQVSKFLCEPSLFGGSNLLHIKTNKTINTKEIKTLINSCKLTPTNALIYEFLEDGSKANADFLRAFDSNFVRFFKPTNQGEGVEILSRYAKLFQANTNTAALNRLYQIHNENLSLCACEISKLCALKVDITIENVENLVFGLSEISFDELFSKVISLQDIKDDFFIFIQSGGYNEIALLNYMYGEFFKLFRINSAIKTTGKFDLKQLLGYIPPPQVANSLKSRALSFNTRTYKEIFMHLNSMDFDLKTKKGIDQTSYLLSGLLALQSTISKAKRR